jgi:type I restriction enzyme S subunit
VTTEKLFSFVTSGSRGWAKHYSDKGSIFLRVGNLDHSAIALDLRDVQHVSAPSGIEADRTRVRPNDLLISVTADVGMVAVVPDGLGEAYINQHIALARPVENVNAAYLAWYLTSEYGGQPQFKLLQRGATKQGLGLDDIRAVDVPLPPFNEQSRIVAKIEELFSDLDAGVAALERIRANLKRYRAAVLKAAVEGKLTEAWRAKHPKTEPASKLLERILAERRKKWEEDQLAKFEAARKTPPKGWREKYIEPAAPDTRGLPELPQGWCWATVEQISHFAKYGSSAKTSADCSGVPVLRMGNIRDGAIDLGDLKYLSQDHDEFPELLLRGGDLLFNRTNSAELVGKSAIYHGNPNPCSYASYLIALRMVCGCIPEFVCYYLNSSYGRAWIASVVSQQVGQANVNGTKLQALVIPVPSEAEQSQIVAEVELRFSNIGAADAQVRANLKRAARLRQSILKRAFEGRLVPQDPTDEPANKLLERVRLDRTARNGDTETPRQPQGRRNSAPKLKHAAEMPDGRDKGRA